MTTNYEHLEVGGEVTAIHLERIWTETLSIYDRLIEEGHHLLPIRFLVRHIIQKGYNHSYFAGTSLFNLLVSIPVNGKVNYTRTLKVEVDHLRNIVRFEYRDSSGVNKDKDQDSGKQTKWSDTCQPTEVCDMFEYFINSYPEWKVDAK